MNKKNSIIKGLFSVMNTYEFSMITVTQIVQEANIGRKTFYRYFKNKEEVLEEAIELLFIEYASIQENYYSPRLEILIYNHFSFWNEHLDYLKLLYKNELMFYLFKQYQKYTAQLNAFYLKEKKLDNNTSKYTNAFITGVFWSMLYTWIENDAAESPSTLAKIILDSFENKVQEDK
ncbi:TetR/AcrR family transcriptional regulator [Listeria monocytogenes]|nr:TetR/AcrR family transcriptional regulator [Listeria monocytogenes]EAD6942960.1 TetR/AcrR family transcriptional regulator [Listeria monocytogenes]EAE1331114.1 TetR/AcrR family transcriptional regulator [Listeria monocytogenes]EAF1158397.1 TetR/AcrR family transcriptional regulator [Listeria monocytogenes]EAH0457919.1 TetR/AcrR family transcriptional regulator [Listeria monocytogenes]